MARKLPLLRRPVSREVVQAELADLLARARLGPCEVLWPAHMDKRHRKHHRSYAQVYPLQKPPVFEFAKAVCRLTRPHRLALLAHEVGHVLAPDAGEDGADEAAHRALGVAIKYDKRWPGKGLQVCGNPGLSLEPVIGPMLANPTEPWEPEEHVPAPAPPPPRRGPLPPEQRPQRDAKRQAKYERRMARKDAAVWARAAESRPVAGPRAAAKDDHATWDGEPIPDWLDHDDAETCLFCGQKAWIDVAEYWPEERRFTLTACCQGNYDTWLPELEAATPEQWQEFMASRAGVTVRTVGGRPELRDQLGVSPEDVFLVDEELSLVRSTSEKARRRGQAPPGALTIDEVREYVRRYHKHAGVPPAGGVWAYAVYNGQPGEIVYDGKPRFTSRKAGRRPLNVRRLPANLIGVALISRPASRLTQQKGEALARVAAGEQIQDVADDMAIGEKTIAKWVASGERPGERVAEVSRVALDHGQPPFVTYKASSMIYERAADDARAAGFTKIQTFTLESESGMSLRYARWKPVATKTGGGQFSRKGRERHVREGELAKPKTRWEKRLT